MDIVFLLRANGDEKAAGSLFWRIVMDRPEDSEERVWGWMLRLWQQREARVERIFVSSGGYSSIHYHREQSNIFSVLSGTLKIRLLHPDSHEPTAEWDLQPGDRPVTIGAGVIHQFEALTDVLALEVYIASNGGDASPADIVRLSTNGVKQLA